MTDLNVNLFKLEQVLSVESPSSIKKFELTSCGNLGVAALSKGHTPLIAFTFENELKIHWISWFQDTALTPLIFCFSNQDDLLLIGTSSGVLCVIPTKSLLSESSGGHKKVRIVKSSNDIEFSRRSDPTAISWWATNEARALAVLGTSQGILIIVDLVDGKEVRLIIDFDSLRPLILLSTYVLTYLITK